MLQDHAALIQQFENAKFANNIPGLAIGALVLVMIYGCAILLARTAAGLNNSRFLKHLSVAFALNATGALVSVIFRLLKAALAHHALDTVNTVHLLPPSFARGWIVMESALRGISIMISLLSNFYLFAAWDLLRRYPDQGVSKSLFTALTAFFGSSSLLIVLINILVIFEKIQNQFEWAWTFIDLTSSAAGILLVGWQLQKTLGKRIVKQIWRRTLPWITFMAYMIWGISQLPHEVFKRAAWYDAILLLSAFAAGILTIILSSQALEEKPEFSSNQAFD